MAVQIYHPTESTDAGPFLVDREQLEILDSTLTAEWARMRCVDTANVLPANAPVSRSTLLLLADGRNALVEDYAEALRDPALCDQLVVSATTDMRSGDRRCFVKIDAAGVQIKVEPRGDALMEQVFTVVSNWKRSVSPAWWLRTWRQISGAHWLVLGIVLLFVWGFVDNSLSRGPRMARTEEVQRLISHGVTQQDFGGALRLLLAQAYQNSIADRSPATPWWFQLFGFGTVAYAILLTFYPKVGLGIGKGATRVALWRWYCRVVAITIPLWVFSSIVLPAVISAIRKLSGAP